MKKLTITLIVVCHFVFESSAQVYTGGWHLLTNLNTLPTIYCGATFYPEFNLFDDYGNIPTPYKIAYNYYSLPASQMPNPSVVWTLTLQPGSSGSAVATFVNSNLTQTMFQNSSNSTCTTPTLDLSNFTGGTTSYTIKAVLHGNYGDPTDVTLTLGSTSFNLVCEYPLGTGSPTADDYCSFQLTPTSFSDPLSGPPYSGATLQFSYGSTQNVYDGTMCTGDGSAPYYTVPGPQASYYAYTITPGWSYFYTTIPNTISIMPPLPTYGPHPAYSVGGILQSSGSGSAASPCLASYAALSLQINFPLDSPPFPYIDTTAPNPPPNPSPNWTNLLASSPQIAFQNPTILNILDGGTGLDLNGLDDVTLTSNLTSDHPELESIDWYEIDANGKQTLVAQNSPNVDVKVEGNYYAMVNLQQGATVDSASDTISNYAGDNYYIAQSNILQVYNSSSSAPDVNSMTIYPNPGCEKVTVGYQLSGKVTSASLLITNASTGVLALKQDVYINQQTQDLDISNLIDGTYVVTLELNDNAFSCNSTLIVMCN